MKERSNCITGSLATFPQDLVGFPFSTDKDRTIKSLRAQSLFWLEQNYRQELITSALLLSESNRVTHRIMSVSRTAPLLAKGNSDIMSTFFRPYNISSSYLCIGGTTLVIRLKPN